MEVIAVLMVPVTVVIVLHPPLMDSGFVPAAQAMGVFVILVNLDICLVNMARMGVMVMSVVIVVKMIHVPFGGMPAGQIVLMLVVMMLMVSVCVRKPTDK